LRQDERPAARGNKLAQGLLCPVCGELVGEPPSPEAPCPKCRYEGPAKDGVEDGVDYRPTIAARSTLAPYVRELAKGPQQRHETALRWAQACAIRGGKPGWVWHRYEEVYGERMAPATWAAVKATCAIEA
jgi:hypothetical protein